MRFIGCRRKVIDKHDQKFNSEPSDKQAKGKNNLVGSNDEVQVSVIQLGGRVDCKARGLGFKS